MKNKYFIFTLGCQMNISDSQRIAQKLDNLGYKSAAEKGADLVIVNACSVRQHAVDRIWGKIKIWQNANKKIMITGCVLPQDKKKLAEKNIVFFNIKDLPKILKQSEIKDYFNIRPKMSGKIAYIPIMTGCDNFCSYCAVPYTRGREASRPMKDIIIEVENALNAGFKNILLLGQNVNSYCKRTCGYNTKSNNFDFIQLLKIIDEIPKDFQFNFISSNPHDMSEEIILTLAKLKKWPHELHLPMQSGDDEILRKMNRKYTSNQYLKLVLKLRSQISDLQLSTDIIIGFPSETKKQFENTVKICKKINFDKAYIAQYSPRPGTAAAKLKDDVPKVEKKRRWLVIDKLINH